MQSIQELKQHGTKIFKTLEIILTEPIETIFEDPILDGHCGQKKIICKASYYVLLEENDKGHRKICLELS